MKHMYICLDTWYTSVPLVDSLGPILQLLEQSHCTELLALLSDLSQICDYSILKVILHLNNPLVVYPIFKELWLCTFADFLYKYCQIQRANVRHKNYIKRKGILNGYLGDRWPLTWNLFSTSIKIPLRKEQFMPFLLYDSGEDFICREGPIISLLDSCSWFISRNMWRLSLFIDLYI